MKNYLNIIHSENLNKFSETSSSCFSAKTTNNIETHRKNDLASNHFYSYFRITAYDPNSDTSAILDSNGKFEKLSAFSLYLVSKGLKIFAVDNGETFTDGNIQKISPNTEKIVMRAHAQGKPIRNNKNITVGDKTYIVS